MIGKFLMVIVLSMSLISASCASHTVVDPEPANIQSVIKPGDTVEIVTKDNKETRFKVTEVTDEAIVGESETVLFTDITTLEEQTVSAGEKILIISIIAIGVVAVVALAIAGGASYCCYPD